MHSSFRRLASYALGDWRSRSRLLFYLFSLVAAAAAAAAVPLFFRRVVDDGLTRHLPSVALTWTALALVASLIAAAGTATSGWLGSAIGQGLTYRLRQDLYRHISRQPVAFFARSRSGALASRVTGDAVEVQQLIQGVLGTLAGQGLTLLLAVIAMITLDPVATVIALAAVPLFLLPIRPFGRRLRVAGRRQSDARALVQHHLTEQLNVEGALAREIFGSHAHDVRQFDAAARKMRDSVISRNANFYASSFFLTALGGFGVASVYGVASLSAGREVSIGTVVALAGLVGLMYGPLTMMATQGIGIGSSLVALERVFEVLDHGHLALPGRSTLPRPVRHLQLDGVWFRHPGPEVTLPSLRSDGEGSEDTPADDASNDTDWVIRDVSVDLRPGTTALVGLTGAGKTTTALLACGVYRPTRGRVLLDGVDLQQIDPSARHASIAVLTQDPFVLHASLRDNLHVAAPDVDLDQIMSALRKAQLLDTIGAMPDGLDTIIGDRGYRLSGGERQRLALARVLLTSPDILIMDEATAHLDTQTERAVTTALDQMKADSIRLVIAHRLSTVRTADQIIVMDHGRMIETGDHDQLVEADGAYASLVRHGARQ